MITINKLLKKYNNKTILNIENFIIKSGINLIIGKNGAGKTTFSKIIVGLIPFEGEIIIKNINIKKDFKIHRSIVGFSEAEPFFPDYVSGESIVNLHIELKGGNLSEVKRIINILDMKSFVHNNIGTYSSGMKKKLGLLLAFIGNNELIVLDEPFTLIDEVARKEVLSLISHYNKKGVNFIISSHQNRRELENVITSSFEIKNSNIIKES
ncbi:MAG: ATP-binding cassette domain-containing protein [Bacteroidales bacterium]|nr:ATP-binding cassette domain-containing protein [Bacteroidales bacterium]